MIPILPHCRTENIELMVKRSSQSCSATFHINSSQKRSGPGLVVLCEGDKDSARCLFLLSRGFGEGTSVGGTPLM